GSVVCSCRPAALAGELGGLWGPLAGASEGAGGGPPAARGAIEGSCQQWSVALAGLAERAAALQRNLHAASGAYTATDGSVMPSD
ncbi:MAG: hypothetical protein ACR2HC_05130, partial [Thermoleophilaceae bacterium]